MKKIISFIIVFMLMFILSACDIGKEDKVEIQKENLYQLAVKLGYTKSIDEWSNKYYEDFISDYNFEETTLYILKDVIYFKIRDHYLEDSYILVTFDDIIDPKDQYKNKQKDYIIDNEIIKWKLSEEDTWKEVVSLKKIVNPVIKTSKEIEFTAIFGKLEWKYKNASVDEFKFLSDIQLYNNYLDRINGYDSHPRRNYGFIDVGDVQESIGFTLLPEMDYVGFKSKEGRNYTILASSETTKIQVASNFITIAEGTGSVDFYLENDESAYIYFESRTYQNYNPEVEYYIKLNYKE